MATTQQQNLKDDLVWSDLYTSLAAPVKKQVYHVGLQSWRGQEYDLAADVIQDTVVRTFLHIQKAQQGEVAPIVSLFSFSKKVATNRLYDIARREVRLVRPSNDVALQEKLIAEHWVDFTEDILNDIDNSSLFMLIARSIVDFPAKQRTALLIDLANLPCVDNGPLQQALRKMGIQLDRYRELLPRSPAEKCRHSASLCIAYKRLRNVVLTQLQLQDKGDSV
jgi:DNA-directed RNA polymerase specialized sigma24 family protein